MQGAGPTDEVSDTAVAPAFAAFYRRHDGALTLDSAASGPFSSATFTR